MSCILRAREYEKKKEQYTIDTKIHGKIRRFGVTGRRRGSQVSFVVVSDTRFGESCRVGEFP